MTDSLPEPASVKFSELLDACEFASMNGPIESSAHICLDTGAIYFISSEVDIEEELSDDIETSDRYIAAPSKADLDLGRALALSFVRAELPDAWDEAADFFRRKGAYGRFKQLLHARGAMEKWYAFEAKATEEALRQWCEDNGVRLTET